MMRLSAPTSLITILLASSLAIVNALEPGSPGYIAVVVCVPVGGGLLLIGLIAFCVYRCKTHKGIDQLYPSLTTSLIADSDSANDPNNELTLSKKKAPSGFKPFFNEVTTTPADAPLFFHGPLSDLAMDDKAVSLSSKWYPYVRPLKVQRSLKNTFVLVRTACEAMKFEVVAEKQDHTKLQATETTSVFKFVDDIVIELRKPKSGDYIEVHARSKSRKGQSDLGANAKRIMTLFEKILALTKLTSDDSDYVAVSLSPSKNVPASPSASLSSASDPTSESSESTNSRTSQEGMSESDQEEEAKEEKKEKGENKEKKEKKEKKAKKGKKVEAKEVVEVAVVELEELEEENIKEDGVEESASDQLSERDQEAEENEEEEDQEEEEEEKESTEASEKKEGDASTEARDDEEEEEEEEEEGEAEAEQVSETEESTPSSTDGTSGSDNSLDEK